LAGLGLASAGATRAPDKAKLDPESEKFYQSARLIMTGEESKIFKRLIDQESRQEFIRDFWDKRDPDPDTEGNEFKAAFEKRVDYANKRFLEGIAGMNTDRGRVYIFLGPPDRFEENFSHGDTSVRGPILWWIYYSHELGVEFVDAQNLGQYKIRRYEGDLFRAMDVYKLGQWVGTSDVFNKKIVNFGLIYDASKKELEVAIPAKVLVLRENDDGKFQVDLDFKFYVYEDGGQKKETFIASESFVTTVAEADSLKTVRFRFEHPLKRGANFVDVIIKGRAGTSSKIRKIFEIKVKN
jgi:GWxTD domain-containing protein